MPSSASAIGRGLLLPAAVVVVVLLLDAVAPAAGCYPRVFSFGDSLADTGNYPFVYGNDSGAAALLPPYAPTARPSSTAPPGAPPMDASWSTSSAALRGSTDLRFGIRVVAADTLGLPLGPLVRLYLSGRSAEDFACGANFAVGGATALSPDEIGARGFDNMGNQVGLDMEMKWFRDLLDLLCPGNLAGCSDMMNQSLSWLEKSGAMTTTFLFFLEFPWRKFTPTPSVVAKISSTISELIRLGAKNLVVPGNLPIGCVPDYLMIFKSDKEEDYEPQTGCLRWMNEFSQYHNKLLVEELKNLRKLHPGVTIIYSDYYGAAMEIFLSPEQYGIEHPLVACCGGEGPYGVSPTTKCGFGEYKLCDNPENTFLLANRFRYPQTATLVSAANI
ncbi:unnamed protein product [Miscanthus lutarioriparius]|uniref:GDSL esterase/lipase n=1 Tax=Miscanthus lutarioriparius TaxID=422564 RepID=A0A811NUZ3_9POAL|nr:unnamed protein product [Miscanthus lutarioriparius]